MRIVFMGTPDFAVPTLTEIVGRGHEVVAVYSRAPAPAGRRGLDLVPSPVHAVAERFGIPVFTPATLRTEEAAEQMRDLAADVAVVVAYGMILPQAILDAPELGCLNLHGSILPRWRGAAPIQRAVMAGDAETGVAVMRMEAGLDTGPVGLLERVTIGPNTTSGELHDRLMVLGADLMGRALAALERGGLHFTPQPEAGRHLCPQDRQGRGAHRLDRAGHRGSQPHSRALAVSRCVVSAGRRHAGEGAALRPRAGFGRCGDRGSGRGAGGGLRRGADYRLRHGRGAAHRSPEGRKAAHGGGHLPAWQPAGGRQPPHMSGVPCPATS